MSICMTRTQKAKPSSTTAKNTTSTYQRNPRNKIRPCLKNSSSASKRTSSVSTARREDWAGLWTKMGGWARSLPWWATREIKQQGPWKISIASPASARRNHKSAWNKNACHKWKQLLGPIGQAGVSFLMISSTIRPRSGRPGTKCSWLCQAALQLQTQSQAGFKDWEILPRV